MKKIKFLCWEVKMLTHHIKSLCLSTIPALVICFCLNPPAYAATDELKGAQVTSYLIQYSTYRYKPYRSPVSINASVSPVYWWGTTWGNSGGALTWAVGLRYKSNQEQFARMESQEKTMRGIFPGTEPSQPFATNFALNTKGSIPMGSQVADITGSISY